MTQAGAWQHVIARGLERGAIFRDERDGSHFGALTRWCRTNPFECGEDFDPIVGIVWIEPNGRGDSVGEDRGLPLSRWAFLGQRGDPNSRPESQPDDVFAKGRWVEDQEDFGADEGVRAS
jgi:hypothetical protein